jgi:PAS domain S-box-containing protein
METTKFRSQLFAALGQMTVYLQRTQDTFLRLARSIAEKRWRLQEALRARKNDLRRLLARSLDAIVVTNGKIIKFRSQLFAALGQVKLYLQQTQNELLRLERSIPEKRWRLKEALRTRENDLRKLLARSLDAIVVTNGKIIKFRSQLSAALGQVRSYLQRTQSALLRLARSIPERRWRLQEAHRARENDLRKLLASSLDAIVVTNGDRRFVAANPKALDLFGISEANMRKFSIDAFVPCGQFLNFDGTGSPFIRQEERSGNCRITRLDGSLRVAEYIFVANFVPRRHLCRFLNVKTLRSNRLTGH